MDSYDPLFDEAKFRTLVLHVAHRTQDDPSFGRTKLAKVLFYSDYQVYAEEGAPITGARYEKYPHGPYPPALPAAERALAQAGYVKLLHDVGELEAKRMVPVGAEPDASEVGIEPWQMIVVDMWVEKISAATAKQISDLTHRHPGWDLALEREHIPWETAAIVIAEPTEQDVQDAQALAERYEWP